MKSQFQLILAVGVFCLSGTKGYAQVFSGYNHGKQILIKKSAVYGNTDLTDFPLLISFTDSDLIWDDGGNGGKVKNQNGFDIIFTTGAECWDSRLDHEIEHYDPTTGQLIAWVKIPLLQASGDPSLDGHDPVQTQNGNTNVHMYYGNPNANTDLSSEQVWSKDFTSVWHLSEDQPPVAPVTNSDNYDHVLGSAPGANHNGKSWIANNGGDILTPPDRVDGQIHYAYDFNGGRDGVEVNDNFDYDFPNSGLSRDLTLSAWVRIEGAYPSATSYIINKKKNNGDRGFELIVRQDNGRIGFSHRRNGTEASNNKYAPVGRAVPLDTWTYIAVTFDNVNKEAVIYNNGVQVGTKSLSDGATYGTTQSLLIGNNARNFSTYSFEHLIDEPRVINAVRSADWLRTEFDNQDDPGSFYIISAEFSSEVLCRTLPIDLMYFNANAQDNSVHIVWETISEQDNDYFEIERSTDGVIFETIATIDGAGDSNKALKYTHVDKTPYCGISYYRLKQTDFDGKFEVFDTRVINNTHLKNGVEIRLYPNPTVSGLINLEVLTGDETSVIKVRVVDINGQLVFKKSYDPSELKIKDKIGESKRLSTGMYFLTLVQGVNYQVKKLIVR